MIDALDPGTWAALLGLVAGTVLGLAARLGRFCTLGAIEDALFGHDFARARLWAIAIATAVAAVHGAAALGWVDLDGNVYLLRPLNIPATLLGGGLFGLGMALVGTCGYGCLARLGGGDLRALVVFLVMGIVAYASLVGAIAVLNAMLLTPLGIAGRWSLGDLVGLPRDAAPLLALGVSLALASWCLRDRAFRRSSRLPWGVASGLAVALGWIGTSWLAAETFDTVTPRSLTFVRPLGDAVVWVMTSSATPLGFGIGAVAGVVLGALAGAILRDELRWEAFDDPREMRRHLLGAALMGVGGVMAFGCTIGQGLTAFSVLAVSAPLTLLAMVGGAWMGLTILMEGSVAAPFRRLTRRSGGAP